MEWVIWVGLLLPAQLSLLDCFLVINENGCMEDTSFAETTDYDTDCIGNWSKENVISELILKPLD